MFRDILQREGESLCLLEIPFEQSFAEAFEWEFDLNVLGAIPSTTILRSKESGAKFACLEVTFEDEEVSAREMIKEMKDIREISNNKHISRFSNFSFNEEDNTVRLFMLFDSGDNPLTSLLQSDPLMSDQKTLDSIILGYLQSFIYLDSLKIKIPPLCADATFVRVLGDSSIWLLPHQLYKNEIELLYKGELDLCDSCISPEELVKLKLLQSQINSSQVNRQSLTQSNAVEGLNSSLFSLGMFLLRLLSQGNPGKIYDRNQLKIDFAQIDIIKNKLATNYPLRISNLLDKLLMSSSPRDNPTIILKNYQLQMQIHKDPFQMQLDYKESDELLQSSEQDRELTKLLFDQQSYESVQSGGHEFSQQNTSKFSQQKDFTFEIKSSQIGKADLQSESDDALLKSNFALEQSAMILEKLYKTRSQREKIEEEQRLEQQFTNDTQKSAQFEEFWMPKQSQFQFPLSRIEEGEHDEEERETGANSHTLPFKNEMFDTYDAEMKASARFKYENKIIKPTYQDSADTKCSSAVSEAQGLSDSDGTGGYNSKPNKREMNPSPANFGIFYQELSTEQNNNKQFNCSFNEVNDQEKKEVDQLMVSFNPKQSLENFNQEIHYIPEGQGLVKNSQERLRQYSNSSFGDPKQNFDLTFQENVSKNASRFDFEAKNEVNELVFPSNKHSFQDSKHVSHSSSLKQVSERGTPYVYQTGIQVNDENLSYFDDNFPKEEGGFKFPTDVIHIVDSGCGSFEEIQQDDHSQSIVQDTFEKSQAQMYSAAEFFQSKLPPLPISFAKRNSMSQVNNMDGEKNQYLEQSEIIPIQQEAQKQSYLQSRCSSQRESSNHIINSQFQKEVLNFFKNDKSDNNFLLSSRQQQSTSTTQIQNNYQNISYSPQQESINKPAGKSWMNKEESVLPSDLVQSASSSSASEWVDKQNKKLQECEISDMDGLNQSKGYDEYSVPSSRNSLIMQSPIQDYLKICINKQESNNQDFQTLKEQKLMRPQNSLTYKPQEYDQISQQSPQGEEEEEVDNFKFFKKDEIIDPSPQIINSNTFFQENKQIASNRGSTTNSNNYNNMNNYIQSSTVYQLGTSHNAQEIFNPKEQVKSKQNSFGNKQYPTNLITFPSNKQQSSTWAINVKKAITLPEFCDLQSRDQMLNSFLSLLNELPDIRKIKYKNAFYKGQVLKTKKSIKKNGLGMQEGENGNLFCGYYNDDLCDGQGVYLFKQGDIYKGCFSKGQRNGFGLYYFHKEGIIYQGEWKANKKEGHGKMHYSNLEYFEGEFQKNQKNGRGIYFFSNGDKFQGEWKGKEEKAQGILIRKDGIDMEGYLAEINCEMEEEQDENQMHLVSYNYQNNIRKQKQVKSIEFSRVQQYSDERIRYFKNGDKYEGTIVEGAREGKGKYYYSNGCYYEGNWKNNMKEGRGKYIFPDETFYEGEFKNSQKNGIGTQTFLRGESYQGQWKNDHRSGYGKYKFSDGCFYEGEWSEDEINGMGTYQIITPQGQHEMRGMWEKGLLVEFDSS